MSSKTPTKTRGAVSVTTAASSSSVSQQRSMSPTRLLRVHEKEQLTQLNDRLSAYIDRVKQLETENNRLLVQIRTCTESTEKETTDLRTMYQAELTSARKLLDETSRENAKLQIEVGKFQAEADDLRVRFARRDKDVAMAERRISQLETEIAASRPERDALRTELFRAQQERDILRKQYETCKRQLEDETLLRVDMQNQIQTLKEEMHFNQELHVRELEKSMQISSTVREDHVSRYQAEYEAKLEEAIQELRDQYAADLRQAREDANAAAERRLKELQVSAERQSTLASSVREEMTALRRRYDEQAGELVHAQQEYGVLQKRVAELEATLQRDRSEYQTQLAALRAEIERLQQELADREQEYQELYDVKVQLDYEIGVYRKLLEAEEVRLNLSDSEAPVRKRRRVEFSETTSGGDVSSSTYDLDRGDVNNYSIDTVTTSGVEFSEVDLGAARYIRLVNHSSEDVPLGGATLHHQVGELKITYKFAKNYVLKAAASVTVYSSDAGVTHNLPTEIVMKNQKWAVGDDMRTELLNSKGEQLCTLRMRLRASEGATSTKSGRRASSHGHNSSKSGASKSDQCALM